MGLRLLAHYYERSEALIARGVLDAAGVSAFLENHDQISLQPFSEIALGGYRLMVCDEELADAISVLKEARRNRSFEGERLSTNHRLGAFLLFLFGQALVFGGLFLYLPLRTHHWRSLEADAEAEAKPKVV